MSLPQSGFGKPGDVVKTLPTPKEIKAHLDQFVVGQERAKKVMSVGVFNHYKRIRAGQDMGKSNMLFIGPTGCGKTFMAQTVAKFLSVPFVIFDCSSLTQNGYSGESADSILFQLYESSGRNIWRAERGIVFLDEVDKIKVNRTSSCDISGRGVQQNLLKMVEGTSVQLHEDGNRKNSDGRTFTMDSSNILFMASGAFCGLDKIVNRRSGKAGSTDWLKEILFRRLGKASSPSFLDEVLYKDLVKFGMIPEFISRFPIIATFQALDEEALLKILNESKGCIFGEYRKLFAVDKVVLEVDHNALVEIARKAFVIGTGARGLRSVVEDLLMDVMFEMPKSGLYRVKISKDLVLGNTSAKLFFRPQKVEPPTDLIGKIEITPKSGGDGNCEV